MLDGAQVTMRCGAASSVTLDAVVVGERERERRRRAAPTGAGEPARGRGCPTAHPVTGRRAPPGPAHGRRPASVHGSSFRSRPPHDDEAPGSRRRPVAVAASSLARRARPNRLEAGLLTSGWALATARTLRSPEPSRAPIRPQWHLSGSLPGHSGATVPDSHRLPSWGPAGVPLPPRATPRRAIRLAADSTPDPAREPLGTLAGIPGRSAPTLRSGEPVRASHVAVLCGRRLTACGRVPSPSPPRHCSPSDHFDSTSTPSPLDEVQAGHVRAVFPEDVGGPAARSDRLAQEGFIASPRLDRFETGRRRGPGAWRPSGSTSGEMRIPSNYYYLAARNEALSIVRDSKPVPPSDAGR